MLDKCAVFAVAACLWPRKVMISPWRKNISLYLTFFSVKKSNDSEVELLSVYFDQDLFVISG